MEPHTITVYTTPTCPYCKHVKAYFDAQQIRYHEVDVTASEEAREEMLQKSGALTVPVIDIDGKIIVGFDQRKIDEALDNPRS